MREEGLYEVFNNLSDNILLLLLLLWLLLVLFPCYCSCYCAAVFAVAAAIVSEVELLSEESLNNVLNKYNYFFVAVAAAAVAAAAVAAVAVAAAAAAVAAVAADAIAQMNKEKELSCCVRKDLTTYSTTSPTMTPVTPRPKSVPEVFITSCRLYRRKLLLNIKRHIVHQLAVVFTCMNVEALFTIAIR